MPIWLVSSVRLAAGITALDGASVPYDTDATASSTRTCRVLATERWPP